METKKLNTQIKGKDGDVQTFNIQKHLPECQMTLIILELNHFLFCQEDHPIIVKKGEYIQTVEAKDVRLYDEIYTDNIICFNSNELCPTVEKEILAENILNNTTSMPDFLLKSSDYDLRLNSNFINYEKHWIKNFLDILIDKCNGGLSLKSIVLTQQLKLMCDRVGYFFTLYGYCKIDESFYIAIKKDEFNAKCKGYQRVVAKIPVSDYKNFVYDIKTDSQEFMLGCVQTHNSFHSGGSVDIKLINYPVELIRNIDDNKKESLEKVIIQEGNDLITNASFTTVFIDKHLFDTEKYKIKRDEKFILLPLGYFDITLDSLKIPVTMEFPTNFYLDNAEMEESDDHILLTYTKGHKVINCIPRSIEPHKIANTVKEVLSGNSPYTNVESLYDKLYSMLKDFSDWDSVHLEVILSNVLRARKDPQLPARLKEPFDPVMYSIKKLPGIISWPLGLAFENYTAAITQGMISERAPESAIEKIMMGDLLADNDAADEERKKRANREKNK